MLSHICIISLFSISYCTGKSLKTLKIYTFIEETQASSRGIGWSVAPCAG